MKKELILSTPSKHQLDALNFLQNNGWSGLLNHDTGTGKTFTAFFYALTLSKKIMEKRGRKAKGIIFCPTNLLPNWAEESKKHLHPFVIKRIFNYDEAPKSHNIAKRAAHLEESGYGIYIAGLSYLRNVDFLRAATQKGFDFLIVDESHHCKTWNAQQTKGLLTLSKVVPCKVLMTGSPLLNSLQDVWSQAHIVGPKVFSTTYWGFLNTYFFDRNKWMKDKDNPESIRKSYHPDWKVLTKKKDELFSRLDTIMHVAKKEECVDLPPYLRQKVLTEMDKDTKKAYNEMLKTLKAEMHGREFEAKNALVKMMRLQQILAFSKCKRELCLETLRGIDLTRHKVVVWSNFREPLIQLYDYIAKHLGSDSMLIAHGEMDKDDRFKLIKKFDKDKSIRIMFATQGALGTGFELTQASYAYYHSKDYKLGHNLQSEGRNYRRGSNIHEQVTRIDGIVKGTSDVAVHRALEQKKGLHEMAKDIRSYIKV